MGRIQVRWVKMFKWGQGGSSKDRSTNLTSYRDPGLIASIIKFTYLRNPPNWWVQQYQTQYHRWLPPGAPEYYQGDIISLCSKKDIKVHGY